MASIRNAMSLDDKSSAPLRKIIQNVQATIAVMEQMNKKINRQSPITKNMNAASLNGVKAGLRGVNTQLDQMAGKAERAAGAGHKLRGGLSALQSFSLNMTGLWATYEILSRIGDKVHEILKSNDEFISVNAKLNLINDGERSQGNMRKDVLSIANDTRSGYAPTASFISRLGMSGSPAFKKTDDILKFSEIVNKSMIISGTTQEENAAVLHQLSQAMGSGRLQGDEFRSISEQAPIFQTMLAKGMGKPVGSLKAMSKEGKLTSEQIYKAMIKMGPEINKMFETMPWTFGQATQVMQNNLMTLLRIGEPIFQRLTEGMKSFAQWLSSPIAQKVAQNMAMWFDTMFQSAKYVFDLIQPLIQYMIKSFNGVKFSERFQKDFQLVANIIANVFRALAPLYPLLRLAFSGLEMVLWATNELTRAMADMVQKSGVTGFLTNIANAADWAGSKFQTLTLRMLQFQASSVQKELDNQKDLKKGFGTELMPGWKHPLAGAYDSSIATKTKELNDINKRIKDAQATISPQLKNHIKNGSTSSNMPGTGMGFQPGKPVPVEVKGGKLHSVHIDKDDMDYLKDVAMKEYAINMRTISPVIHAKFGDIHETADVDEVLYKIEEKIAGISGAGIG